MSQKINNLRNFLKENNLKAAIISSQSNNFYYSNYTGSAAILYISLTKSVIITDFRYEEQVKEECSDFEPIIRKNNETYNYHLNKLIADEQIDQIGFEGNYLTYNEYESYKKNVKAELVNIQLDTLRVIKSNDEIELIKKACDIADKAFTHIIQFIKAGMSEKEVEFELISFLRKNDTIESFTPIVASGYRGALPHGHASHKIIQDGELLTLDFGCVYKGYCSDMTRTVAIGDIKNQELLKIYNIVLDAQILAVKSAKAGMKASDLDKIARDHIANNGYKENFGHSLGHGLGIQVHDNLAISPTNDLILKEGMVITIEPGIYIEGLGGVRIEDDVVITLDGCIILNNSKKDLIILNN